MHNQLISVCPGKLENLKQTQVQGTQLVVKQKCAHHKVKIEGSHLLETVLCGKAEMYKQQGNDTWAKVETVEDESTAELGWLHV